MGGVRWNEQQYQDFMRRQQAPAAKEPRKTGGDGKPPAVAPGTLAFEIPMELSPGVNGAKGLKRMHWAAEKKLRERIACLLRAQAPLNLPLPFEWAKVELIRYSSQQPDKDNLHGLVKPLLDAMQVSSKRHPYGAGIIVDDSPDHIDLTVRWEKCSPRKGKTIALVTPLETKPC